MHLDTSGGGPDTSEFSVSPEQHRVVPSSQEFLEEKQELEWVLSHPEISRSASLVRFLSFVCNKHFDGKSQEIREHTIAVEALGRKQSNFDSHADPIVRVTARTLRKKLQNIYKSDGQDHRLQIVLPLGHYVPEFVRRSDSGAESAIPAEAVSTGQIQPEGPESRDNIAAATPLEDAGNAKRKRYKELLTFGAKHRTVWKFAAIILAVGVIFYAGFVIGRRENNQARPTVDSFKWGEPVWSDDFDGAAQQLPDSSKWTYDQENQEGGSGVRVVYCSAAGGRSRDCDPHHPNAFQDGSGHLVLRAAKNANGVWDLVRITTKDLKSFQYGRIEARMRMPVGKGLWPSFLMVGADKDTVGWPASGSVDIVENVSLTPGANGLGPTMIRSTLHGPRYFGSNGLWHDFKLPNGARIDDGSFHTYGIIWSPGLIQFYVDDPANIYFIHDASDLPEGGAWVFDHPFYLMMSLAVGGDWAGDPDASTPTPADVLVDYVRVYKIPTVPAPSIEWQPVKVKAGSSAASTISLHASSYAGRVHLACSTVPATATCALATPVVNFSNTLSQEDTLTISTDSFTEKGRMVASPGHYKVTITATTMSGDRSQLTVPFEVKNGE
jgi:beta-glucanase (GH16 family)